MLYSTKIKYCNATATKNAFGQTENTSEDKTEQKLTSHKNNLRLARNN